MFNWKRTENEQWHFELWCWNGKNKFESGLQRFLSRSALTVLYNMVKSCTMQYSQRENLWGGVKADMQLRAECDCV